MNLKIQKENLKEKPEMVLKRAGYAYIFSRATGKGSFVRRLARDHYPRIHMYVEDHDDFFVFSLHLDQKQVSYKGAKAHNADYDGPVVETEMTRLQEIVGGEVMGKVRLRQAEQSNAIKPEVQKSAQRTSSGSLDGIPSAEESVGQGDLDDLDVGDDEPKKSWFSKFF